MKRNDFFKILKIHLENDCISRSVLLEQLQKHLSVYVPVLYTTNGV